MRRKVKGPRWRNALWSGLLRKSHEQNVQICAYRRCCVPRRCAATGTVPNPPFRCRGPHGSSGGHSPAAGALGMTRCTRERSTLGRSPDGSSGFVALRRARPRRTVSARRSSELVASRIVKGRAYRRTRATAAGRGRGSDRSVVPSRRQRAERHAPVRARVRAGGGARDRAPCAAAARPRGDRAVRAARRRGPVDPARRRHGGGRGHGRTRDQDRRARPAVASLERSSTVQTA
jgi:hypothetical protein